jgi:hypothetical protein
MSRYTAEHLEEISFAWTQTRKTKSVSSVPAKQVASGLVSEIPRGQDSYRLKQPRPIYSRGP